MENISRESMALWNDHQYKIHRHGKTIDAVILGELHFTVDMIRKQLELIDFVKPDYILHEGAGAWIYDPAAQKFKKQPKRKYDELDRDTELIGLPREMIEASDSTGFKIIGCDLTNAEIHVIGRQFAANDPKTYTFYEEWELLAKNDDENWTFTAQSDEIMPYRDNHMSNTIIAYQSTATKPVITIIGAAHARNIHKQKLLQKKGFGYAVVDQPSGINTTAPS